MDDSLHIEKENLEQEQVIQQLSPIRPLQITVGADQPQDLNDNQVGYDSNELIFKFLFNQNQQMDQELAPQQQEQNSVCMLDFQMQSLRSVEIVKIQKKTSIIESEKKLPPPTTQAEIDSNHNSGAENENTLVNEKVFEKQGTQNNQEQNKEQSISSNPVIHQNSDDKLVDKQSTIPQQEDKYSSNLPLKYCFVNPKEDLHNESIKQIKFFNVNGINEMNIPPEMNQQIISPRSEEEALMISYRKVEEVNSRQQNNSAGKKISNGNPEKQKNPLLLKLQKISNIKQLQNNNNNNKTSQNYNQSKNDNYQQNENNSNGVNHSSQGKWQSLKSKLNVNLEEVESKLQKAKQGFSALKKQRQDNLRQAIQQIIEQSKHTSPIKVQKPEEDEYSVNTSDVQTPNEIEEEMKIEAQADEMTKNFFNQNNLQSPLNFGSNTSSANNCQKFRRKGVILDPSQLNITQELWDKVKFSMKNMIKVKIQKENQQKMEKLSFNETTIIEQNKWVIHPDSNFKTLWNILIILMMIYTATYMAYRVCFVDNQSDFWDNVDLIMNIVFGFDILVSFLSAYYDDENILVTNNKYIAINYLKTWFIIDVLAVIPFQDIFTVQTDSSEQDVNNPQNYNNLVRLARLPRLYRLIRLFRLVRLAKFKKVQNMSAMGKVMDAIFKLNASIKRMFTTMVFAVLAVHLSACFYYLIAKIDTTTTDDWVRHLRLENEEPFLIYIYSLNWSIQTLTTVGFGDVPAKSDLEKLYAIIWMGFAGAFFSFMISNLQGAAATGSQETLKQKFTQLINLSKELNLPTDLVFKIKKQLEYSHQELRHHVTIKNAEFIDQLPKNLKLHVLLCVFANILNKVPFFVGKDIELIQQFVPCLNATMLKAGDYIYQDEDIAEEVFFVYQGKIKVVDSKGDLIAQFQQGNMFGELEVFCIFPRIGSAMALTNTSLFSISQDKFMNMILEFPEIMQEIKAELDKQKIVYDRFLSEEDRIVLKKPFVSLLDAWKENFAAKGNYQISLERYNIQGNTLNFHQNSLHKDDPLASAFSDPTLFQEEDCLYFNSDQDIDLFIKDLSGHYDKDIQMFIEDQINDSAKLKKNLRIKIDYFEKMSIKLKELTTQVGFINNLIKQQRDFKN